MVVETHTGPSTNERRLCFERIPQESIRYMTSSTYLTPACLTVKANINTIRSAPVVHKPPRKTDFIPCSRTTEGTLLHARHARVLFPFFSVAKIMEVHTEDYKRLFGGADGPGASYSEVVPEDALFLPQGGADAAAEEVGVYCCLVFSGRGGGSLM